MSHLTHLSDEALLENTRICARNERERTAILVAHLAEIYRRDLALKRGYSSIYQYTREELQLSEAMAWERGSAARLAVQIPETIDKLSRGELTLASACELFKTIREIEKPKREIALPRLQEELVPIQAPETPPLKFGLTEKRELLSQVLGKTRRESVEVLQTWKEERAGIATTPKKHELSFDLSDEELAQFNRLRDLLSHKLGTRDPKAVLLWLMKNGLEKVDPVLKEERAQKRNTRKTGSEKLGFQEAPQKTPEMTNARKPLPAALKRRVHIRDEGRCQHTDPQTGRKCGATAFLDYDHRKPLSEGGTHDENNLRLMCASHNRRRPNWADGDQPSLSSSASN